MIGYLHQFNAFIREKLPTYKDTFAAEDMIAWVQTTEPQRTARNIREHLLKRTTNYPVRDNNIPPSSQAVDLFYMSGPNLFKRYQLGVDPEAIHLKSNTGSAQEKRKARAVNLRKRDDESTGGLRVVGDVVTRFKTAVAELDLAFAGRSLEDEIISTSVRAWLDGKDRPLPWTLPEGLTDDEWFFITTLCGTMTADGQRTHIRKFFPTLFV